MRPIAEPSVQSFASLLQMTGLDSLVMVIVAVVLVVSFREKTYPPWAMIVLAVVPSRKCGIRYIFSVYNTQPSFA